VGLVVLERLKGYLVDLEDLVALRDLVVPVVLEDLFNLEGLVVLEDLFHLEGLVGL